jgi:HAD superfamily hydrolase (TIGR01509 family)
MDTAEPYRDIETLFLDAGNTMVSIDFAWVSEELGRAGVVCPAAAIERAEAAARPRVSERLAHHGSTEGEDAFTVYLGEILRELVGRGHLSWEQVPVIVTALPPVLKAPGANVRLWSRVLPGVAAALRRLRDMGLRLVVVSNSDGSVGELLARTGLRPLLDAVVDSHEVGAEKPDPRVFEHALEVSGADRSTTMHVGDLYFADIVGARAAGIRAVLLDPCDDWGERDCPKARDLAEVAERLDAARGC